jgi:F-type H+-transporting ATPase subunit delta
MSSVAKVYGQAIFEIAREKKELEPIDQNFREFLEFLKANPGLKKAFSSLTFPMTERKNLAVKICEQLELHPELTHLIRLLVAKNRYRIFESIYDSFHELLDQSKNIIRGTVTSVEPLTSGQQKDLSKAFAKKLNKQVELEAKTDRALLGGIVVQIHGSGYGITFDGSLRTKIRRLKENLERQIS